MAHPAGTAEAASQQEAEAEAGRTATAESTEAIQRKFEQQETYIDELKGKVSAEITKREAASQEMAELKGRVEEQGNLLAGRGTEEEEASPWDMDEEKLDEYRNDPAKFFEVIKAQETRAAESQEALVVRLGEVLELQSKTQQELNLSIDQRLRQADPEVVAWKPAMEALKQKDAYKDLPDETLMAIAKDQGMSPDYESQGAAGGQRPRQGSSPTAATAEQRNIIKSRYMIMTDNDNEEAEKLTAIHLQEQQ